IAPRTEYRGVLACGILATASPAPYLSDEALRRRAATRAPGEGCRERETIMNFEKFSERARGFVQAAQTIALRENHQRVMPEHLLKALLDDDQGFASNLINAAGGDARAAKAA